MGVMFMITNDTYFHKFIKVIMILIVNMYICLENVNLNNLKIKSFVTIHGIPRSLLNC